MIFRLPEMDDRDILQAYVQEHMDHQEQRISASMGLTSSVYSAWVEKIKRNAAVGDDAWGKSLLYLCFDEEKLIGLLSIRYELPQELSNQYGDIGYGVRPTERNKGYAAKMLQYALTVCKQKGMERVMMGCYKDNIPSVKVIRKNGGLLIGESEKDREGRISQYYQIQLEQMGDI